MKSVLIQIHKKTLHSKKIKIKIRLNNEKNKNFKKYEKLF